MSFNEFYDSTISEKKLSIQRFSGSNEMSDTQLLKFLHQLQGIAAKGTIDLSTNDKVSMTEKFDGSPANWGLNPEFFMESANSGEVTSSNIEKFNNPYTIHFYKAFKFLSEYKPFLDRLKKAQSYADEPVKFTSEMFPVLTHKGNDCGDFIFCSTKYNKSKLGNSGAFMIFDVSVKHGDSWVEANEDIHEILIDIVRTPEDPEWKVYYADRDGKLNGTLQFEFSGINDWISSPTKLASSVALLKNKNDPNTKNLKDLIQKIRPGLQQQLDAYAENTSSSLGNATGKSPIEGVVLKVNLPTGPTFIKGTSQIFHDIASGTWGTRKELGAIEKTLTGQFLKDVIGLRTDQPAALNRAIAEIGKTFQSDKQGEERTNVFVDELRKKLQTDGSSTTDIIARTKAKQYLDVANKQLNDIEQKWQQTLTTVDPDTIDKTENQMAYTKEMLKKLQSRIVDTEYIGDAYMVYLLRMIIGRRIENYINNDSNVGEIDELNNSIGEEELNELNVTALTTNLITKLKDLIVKKPQPQLPSKRPTDDDLSDIDLQIHPSTHAVNDIDFANIQDQDPEWNQKVKGYVVKILKLNNISDESINNLLVKFDKDPDSVAKRVLDKFGGNLRDIRDQLRGHDETDKNIRDAKKGKLRAYLRGDTDELDEEASEEFDEYEILDERKFEKVKMARNVLSKLGHPKAYDRNDDGKYILRSKHIKKLMKKLNYIFSDEKSRWIMDTQEPISKPEKTSVEPIITEPSVDKTPNVITSEKNAIIWIGRAQPWHKGHDVLIQKGLEKLKEVGANMIFIMLVKGSITSMDVNKNPMDFDAQIKLIGDVYEKEQAVDISSLPVATGSIVDILVTASKQGIIVKGWLAGSDRIAGYQEQFKTFKTDKYKAEFQQKTSLAAQYPLDGDITFIDVGREEESTPKPTTKDAKELANADKVAKHDAMAVKAKSVDTPTISTEHMSGSLARSLVTKLDFDHWFKEVCPLKYTSSKSAKLGYQETYDILGGKEKNEVLETYFETKSLRESLSNIFFRE